MGTPDFKWTPKTRAFVDALQKIVDEVSKERKNTESSEFIETILKGDADAVAEKLVGVAVRAEEKRLDEFSHLPPEALVGMDAAAVSAAMTEQAITSMKMHVEYYSGMDDAPLPSTGLWDVVKRTTVVAAKLSVQVLAYPVYPVLASLTRVQVAAMTDYDAEHPNQEMFKEEIAAAPYAMYSPLPDVPDAGALRQVAISSRTFLIRVLEWGMTPPGAPPDVVDKRGGKKFSAEKAAALERFKKKQAGYPVTFKEDPFNWLVQFVGSSATMIDIVSHMSIEAARLYVSMEVAMNMLTKNVENLTEEAIKDLRVMDAINRTSESVSKIPGVAELNNRDTMTSFLKEVDALSLGSIANPDVYKALHDAIMKNPHVSVGPRSVAGEGVCALDGEDLEQARERFGLFQGMTETSATVQETLKKGVQVFKDLAEDLKPKPSEFYVKVANAVNSIIVEKLGRGALSFIGSMRVLSWASVKLGARDVFSEWITYLVSWIDPFSYAVAAMKNVIHGSILDYFPGFKQIDMLVAPTFVFYVHQGGIVHAALRTTLNCILYVLLSRFDLVGAIVGAYFLTDPALGLFDRFGLMRFVYNILELLGDFFDRHVVTTATIDKISSVIERTFRPIHLPFGIAIGFLSSLMTGAYLINHIHTSFSVLLESFAAFDPLYAGVVVAGAGATSFLITKYLTAQEGKTRRWDDVLFDYGSIFAMRPDITVAGIRAASFYTYLSTHDFATEDLHGYTTPGAKMRERPSLATGLWRFGQASAQAMSLNQMPIFDPSEPLNFVVRDASTLTDAEKNAHARLAAETAEFRSFQCLAYSVSKGLSYEQYKACRVSVYASTLAGIEYSRLEKAFADIHAERVQRIYV